MSKSILIDSLAIGGYRSFGSVQYFERLGKVNLFIGQNNCGKSNILKFVHEVLPSIANGKQCKLDALDRHIGKDNQFSVGVAIDLSEVPNLITHLYTQKHKIPTKSKVDLLTKVMAEKASLDKTGKFVWFFYDSSSKFEISNWENAFSVLQNRDLHQIWFDLTQYTSGGSRERDWFPNVLDVLKTKHKPIKVAIIPAIRKVGEKNSLSEEFSGEGLIERLVRLQNPGVHDQESRKQFEKINIFLQSVTGNDSARLEIPHERDTILVHMDSKTLPLESLGTGIHEVVILAAAATILENHVVCMEEPELHLNPLLQKKLIRYLESNTNNQYFISTHSASFMDTADAEIYHIQLEDGESKATRVTTDSKKSEICAELGYLPSDLIQANTIIWVEGPSDRIYLNFWLKHLKPEFVEGIHYSIMFYGGRLLSHLSGDDLSEEDVNRFISLRKLNRRGVILIDSDRVSKGKHLNTTKSRLRDEFDNGNGHAWVTRGREIENYIKSSEIEAAIRAAHPKSIPACKFGVYDNMLLLRPVKNPKKYASKVKVAKYVTENNQPDLDVLNLKEEMNKIVKFIEESVI